MLRTRDEGGRDTAYEYAIRFCIDTQLYYGKKETIFYSCRCPHNAQGIAKAHCDLVRRDSIGRLLGGINDTVDTIADRRGHYTERM